MEKTKEPDLIDRIADALPPEVRTAYYREMRHCKSLPESDEMLRILRAMMFLTLLTEQVPNRVLTEREKFEAASHEIVAIAKRLITVGSEYYQKLDKQLTRLPDEIATGVNPVAIVERINGSLKRQFDLSTIPVVAKELAANAGSIKTATKEYAQAMAKLCDSWHSASDKAHKAIRDINTSVVGAAKAAEEAAEKFTRFLDKPSLCIAFIFGLEIGFGFGFWFFHH